MYTYLLKELYQFQTRQLQTQHKNNPNIKVIFKNCPPFTDCITEIKNTQKDDVQKIDVVMPMYNLIEYAQVYGNTIYMNQI